MKTKITIDIDCTPTEARELVGYPNLQAIHERLAREIEQRLLDGAEKFSPEAVLQQWFGAWPAGFEQMRLALENLAKNKGGQ
jgi:Family of unknown function (DUF6489)